MTADHPGQRREPIALTLLRVLAGAVFLWASLSKLMWMESAGYGYTFIGSLLAARPALAVGVSVIEGAAALALLFRFHVRTASALLCAGLAAVGLLYLLRANPEQACGCMGPEQTERLIAVSVPIRIALMVFALGVLALRAGPARSATG